MRRLTALLLIGICLIANAFSVGELYTERGCDCNEQPCSCFMQFGDEGTPVKAVITVLKEKGYLPDVIDATYSFEVEEAVKKLQREYALEETGMMDDETLTYLIWGMSSEELDAARSDLTLDVVYVPTDGGKKFHRKDDCSDMLDPRKISRRNAEEIGIEGCRKRGCYPDYGK